MAASSLVLFISNVWPEPDSSAAGTHSLQLMRALKRWAGPQAELVWASTAAASRFALPEAAAPCRYAAISMNDEAADKQLQRLRPAVVVFDRFMAEEQFGWRVREQCPNALRLLHTQDLHLLRRHRQQQPGQPDRRALETETALRELAAIFRCDLSLIISRAEVEFLQSQAEVPPALLHYFPLTATALPPEKLPAFEERQDFVSIGNFLHPPNKDAVIRLKTTYWPALRQRLPRAVLRVYGAYCPPHIMQMSRPEEGFLVAGRAPKVQDVLAPARLLLAPLRYGAGLKGKLLDAMRYGTPSITTPAGAEGIAAPNAWPGYVLSADASPHAFAAQASALYTHETAWQTASDNGRQLLAKSFHEEQHSEALLQKLQQLFAYLPQHRARNLIGRLLCHHQQASTRYMSLWIQEKEKHRRTITRKKET